MNQLQTEELLLLDEVQAEEEYKERFKITDLSGADWAFEKLAAIKTRMKEKEALAEEKRYKIDAWLESETAKDKQSAEYFEMENGKVQVDDIEKYARKYYETKVAEL